MKTLRWAESIAVLLPVRLGLAVLFGLAAALKLADPQAFAFSIKAIKIFSPTEQGHILVMLAFGIPWTEMIIAVLLLLGLWTRASALLLALLLAGFTAGLLSVIARGIDTDCACFGELELFCKGGVGWCHIGRNSILLLASALLVWRGGGKLAVDTLLEGKSPDKSPDVEPTNQPA